MADENRRKIIDRANRILRQSKILRKLSDELLRESKDLRQAAHGVETKKKKRARR